MLKLLRRGSVRVMDSQDSGGLVAVKRKVST